MLVATLLPTVFLLLGPACGKQQPMLPTGPSSWNNVGDSPPSVQLDPELRRALLRALTQLENEAKDQDAGELFASNSTADQVDDDVQESLKSDLKRLIGNFRIEDTNEDDHKADIDDGRETQRMSEVEDSYRDDIPETYPEDFSDSKHPIQENFQEVSDYITSRDMKSLEVSTNSDELLELGTPSPTDLPTQAAIFYRDTDPEVQKKTTELPQEANIIVHPNDVVTSPAEIQNSRDASPQQKSASSDIIVSPTAPSAAITKSGVADGDVSIFQAPLVTAFTLQQDESGLPTSVIPLIPPQPTAPSSPDNYQQQQLLLFREQELLHRTRLLEQQLAQFQQQRLQQQRLQQQRLQQQRLDQQRLEQQRLEQQRLDQQRLDQQRLEQQRLEQQRLEQQRLEQQRLEQQFFQQQQQQQQQQQNRQPLFPPQQQFIPVAGSSRRPQRQETGTGIVDFQPSIEFPLNQNNQPAPAASSLVQHQALHPQFRGSFTFQQSPGFLAVSPSHQNGLVPPPVPLQQPPSFIPRHVPSSHANQLQSLLYRAGVPDTPQQDLSIVSKVLSLNHLRRQDDTLSPPTHST